MGGPARAHACFLLFLLLLPLSVVGQDSSEQDSSELIRVDKSGPSLALAWIAVVLLVGLAGKSYQRGWVGG